MNQSEIEDLFERCHTHQLSDEQMGELAILLDSDPDAARRFVEEMTLSANLGSVMQASRLTPLRNHHGRRSFSQRAVPILLLVFLAFALIPGTDLFFSSETEVIGTIAGSGGSLVWTAGNGQLVDLPGQGGGVTGGTIEGLSPDAWFCLEFRDGSRVTVSGISVLTVSDEGQKRLRLREGRISVSATQQPDKRPMLVWTRSAELQVLGTQFDVISDANQTSLSVSEGQVRLRRRSDRQELVVPAMHRVVVDPVLPLELQQPGTVRFWESDVAAGPGCYGRWVPAEGGDPAIQRSAPLIPEKAPNITLDLLSLSVVSPDGADVLLESDAQVEVTGRIKSACRIYCGINVSNSSGEFAGKYRLDAGNRQPLTTPDADGNFRLVYSLQTTWLDPSVEDEKERFEPSPHGRMLDHVWFFANAAERSGLEVTQVRLIPVNRQALH